MTRGDDKFAPLGDRSRGDRDLTPVIPGPRNLYWVEEAHGPGYGVTAATPAQAIALAEELAWRRKMPFELRGVIENFDPATLPEAISRWMDPPTSLGVWFPGSSKGMVVGQPLDGPAATGIGPVPVSAEAEIDRRERNFDDRFRAAYRRWIPTVIVCAIIGYSLRRYARWPYGAGVVLTLLLAILAMAIQGTGFVRYMPVPLTRARRIQMGVLAIIGLGVLSAIFIAEQ